MNKYTDIKVGDVVVCYDEYSHDYLLHRVIVRNIEFDECYVTGSNPTGIVCYGEDLDEIDWGDDYINKITEGNFCRIMQ